MGRLLGFLWGFILSFFKLLFGSILLCVIVGFFFMPALYVLVPLSAIAIVVESFKEGVERAKGYQFDEKQPGQDVQKHMRQLQRAFKEDELYEFDKAWKQMSRN
ncbi:hypothetical protein OCA08_21590 [Bacillus cereus]|nr:hypothetical protein [Bacillus cereus]PEU85834.1 hypothetical protein CN386_01715 [Bacillus cereus]